MRQEDAGLGLRNVCSPADCDVGSDFSQMLTKHHTVGYTLRNSSSLWSTVKTSLDPYITSEFGEHGFTAVVGVVSTITGGVCNLFIAKVLDIRGRVEGFFLMLFLIVIGAIMKAACHNIETYAAANTIYWVSETPKGSRPTYPY